MDAEADVLVLTLPLAEPLAVPAEPPSGIVVDTPSTEPTFAIAVLKLAVSPRLIAVLVPTPSTVTLFVVSPSVSKDLANVPEIEPELDYSNASSVSSPLSTTTVSDVWPCLLRLPQ